MDFNKTVSNIFENAKIKTDVKSITSRKKKAMAAVTGEIKQLDTTLEFLCGKMGKRAYQTRGEIKDDAEFLELLSKADDINGKISEKRKQLDEIEEEYNLSIAAVTNAADNYIICPNCGEKNGEGALFCEKCGTRLEAFAAPPVQAEEKSAVNVCPNCGRENTPSDMFCGNCGSKLG